MQMGVELSLNSISNMREFLKIMGKDLHAENFTRKECIVYGVIVPMTLVIISIVGGAL
jgi:hypothetical protein